jgi:glycosyltransferase involved in cell wall biosynthesis
MFDCAPAKNIGIYNLHMPTRGGGEKLTLVLAEYLSRNHQVHVFHNAPLEPGVLEETFAVDLSHVQFTELDRIKLPLRMLAKVRGRKVPFSAHHYLQLKKLKLDLFVNISYGSVLPSPAARAIFLCMFPHELKPNRNSWQRVRDDVSAAFERRVTGKEAKRWLDSYSEVIAISKYSAAWVERLWGRNAEVIYPPVDDMGPPTRKEKIILNVGRFKPSSGGGHNKAQEVLLAAFRKMKELHEEGWELHFVGNIGKDTDEQKFAKTIQEKASGLPVRFHLNATFEELRNLYRRAAIYWHATGIGAEQHPASQEHFGITTVEAMSAGAVPVVINSGGQRETVTDGVDGLCWNDVDGLMRKTQSLIHDSALSERLSQVAIESSKKFRREALVERMGESITRVLAGPRD